MVKPKILQLVKKPYEISNDNVSIALKATGFTFSTGSLDYSYRMGQRHDIGFAFAGAQCYEQKELILYHFLGPESSSGLCRYEKTPIVPSATIMGFSKLSEAESWLLKEWFGSEAMKKKAHMVINSIAEQGCVIYDYQHTEAKVDPEDPSRRLFPPLSYIDTNVGRYILPSELLEPAFLARKCYL